MKRSIFLILSICVLTACGDSEPPVKIEAFADVNPGWANFKYAKVKVTAIVDEVEIEDITVNRGNCERQRKDELPVTLKFGEPFSASFIYPCSVTQVDVETDQGVWSVSY